VVEVDGAHHLDAAQREQDAERTAWLQAHGLEVIRFSNQEVIGEPERVISQIRALLGAQPSPRPSPSGRGRSEPRPSPSGRGRSEARRNLPSPASVRGPS
jgi:hypothetical protein